MATKYRNSSSTHSSSLSNESKLEKEKARLIQEKCQGMLNDMLRDDDNKYCVDCDAKGPRWASWNLGIFLCIRCAGIHRNLGVHISKVKSVNLDTWTPEQVMTMSQFGNSRARAIYEANLPDATRRPQTDVSLETFIRAKYEHKKYIAKEYIPQPIEKPNWDQEIEEMLKKKKKSGASGSTDIVLPSKQFAASAAASRINKTSNKEQQQSKDKSVDKSATSVSVPATAAQNLSDDLLGLSLDSNNGPTSSTDSQLISTTADPFASPTKEPSTTTNNTASTSDDLFSLETGGAGGGNGIDLLVTNKPMSKESIMSLYGKNNSGNGNGGIPQQQQQQQQLGGGLAGLNPFLVGNNGSTTGTSSTGLDFLQQLQPQQQRFGTGAAGASGFGMQQVTPSQQQQFLFNNNLMAGPGLGLVSTPQQQLFQFQQAPSTPATGGGAGGGLMGIGIPPPPQQQQNQFTSYPAQQQQMQNQFMAMRSPQQLPNTNAFLFAQPTPTSPPNFLN